MTRNKSIKLTLSDDEFEKISERARHAGLSLASLTRTSALGLPIPRPKVQIEREAVAALNRVGGNLNRIVKLANAQNFLTKDQVHALGQVVGKVHQTASAIVKSGA